MKLHRSKKSAKFRLKKAAIAAVGAVTAASLLINSAFSSPKDIVGIFPESPPAIVQVDETDCQPVTNPTDFQKKKTWKERLQAKLLHLPVWLRAVLLFPLWCIGAVLLWIGERILPGVFKWLLNALLPAAALIAGLKTLFPDVPLSKLLRRKNRIALITVAALLLIAGPVLGYFFPDKQYYALAAKIGIFLIAFGVANVQLWHTTHAETPKTVINSI